MFAFIKNFSFKNDDLLIKIDKPDSEDILKLNWRMSESQIKNIIKLCNIEKIYELTFINILGLEEKYLKFIGGDIETFSSLLNIPLLKFNQKLNIQEKINSNYISLIEIKLIYDCNLIF
jgi:hypothetical protein